jgi:hypothetical protein
MAIGIERQLGLGDVVAGLGVAEKRLQVRPAFVRWSRRPLSTGGHLF